MWTDQPDHILRAKLDLIVHRALVRIRNLTAAGECEHAYELAEMAHELPALPGYWGDWSLDFVRDCIRHYEKKYAGTSDNFAMILEMDDESFTRDYLDGRTPAEVTPEFVT